jgi:DNA-binding LacI/PurR family transcriptional regulator
MKRSSPALKDVAAAADVSMATASVVINNKVGSKVRVGTETRERIWAAARRIGYVGNPAARSLAGGRNDIIAIFSYEQVFPVGQDVFYHSLLLGIEQEAETQGLDLLLVTYRGEKKDERQRRIHRLRFADGAILLGLERDESEIADLVRSGYKLVVIGKREFTDVDVSYVAPDYADATRKIVDRALNLGHRQLCYVQWEGNRVPSLEREIGFRSSVAACPSSTHHILSYPEDDIDTDAIIGAAKNGVTCFVVERFQTAGIIYSALQEAGFSVPDEISLCVLGGPGRELLAEIDWTMIDVPGSQLGRAATQMLMKLLEGSDNEPLRQILACRIHEGSTLRPVSSRAAAGESKEKS